MLSEMTPEKSARAPFNDTTAPFGFTFGSSHTQAEWSDFRRLTWPQIVQELTSHKPGQKEGSCIVPAQFSGLRRHKNDAQRIDVAFLDSDSGLPLSTIEANLKRRGWEAVVSSTHSHMTTQTKVSLSNWDRFFSRNEDATAEDYLVRVKGYLPSVARGAKAESADEQFVYVRHQQCPKFRIVVPLDAPWLASNYPNQEAANIGWKERIEALAAALELDHDQACTDTSRLFYLPRRPANGVVPETAVVAGQHCDLFALPRADVGGDLFTPGMVRRKAEAEQENPEYLDPITGEIVDLAAWARDAGERFLIAKALQTRKPGVLTGHNTENKVHIDCPNGEQHTESARDGATFVMNATASSNKGFVIHCRHGHCTGKDRLFFVKKMLQQNWLTWDDLNDPQFSTKVIEDKPKTAPGDLPIVYFEDINPVRDAKDFVQGLLIEQSAAVIYGESNAGKTFFATDLALSVAAGDLWCGRRVEPGGVVYCVLEGGIGFYNRVSAWKAERGLQHTPLPFGAIPSGLNLLDPEADTTRLIKAIKMAAEHMGCPVKLVVIDTLARAMAGGNENSSEDMGALVMNMDAIRAATQAAVMFIHHSGKDQAKGARGHSSLRAAIDTEIEVVADETSMAKTASVVKQRDMKKGDVFSFTLRVVELGPNRHGEQVTTCIVDYGQDQAAGAASDRRRRLTGHTKRALEVLADLVITSGRGGFACVPPHAKSVPEKWWRERFYESALAGAEQDAKQKAFRRAADALLEHHRIGMAGGRVWVAGGSEPDSAPDNQPDMEE